jgi:hypothetical protein
MESHFIENCPNICESDWEKKCPITWEKLALSNNKLCSEIKLDCKNCSKTVIWASDIEDSINLIKDNQIVSFTPPGRVIKQTLDFYHGGLRGYIWLSKEEYDESGPMIYHGRKCF